MVQKALCGRDSQVIEETGATCIDIRIEDGADFGRFQVSSLNHGESREVDDQLRIGDGDVAGDGFCRVARGGPVSLILRGAGESAEEHEAQNRVEENFNLHSLRMTYGNKKAGDNLPAFCQTSGELDHLDHPELESQLQLIHIREELGIVANLFEATD